MEDANKVLYSEAEHKTTLRLLVGFLGSIYKMRRISKEMRREWEAEERERQRDRKSIEVIIQSSFRLKVYGATHKCCQNYFFPLEALSLLIWTGSQLVNKYVIHTPSPFNEVPFH